jgi:predicted CopG family antitoxin
MGAKSVALGPEAYDVLRRLRRRGETFSDAVKRLAGRRRSILPYAGRWRKMPEDELEKVRTYLAAGRRRDRERLERLFGGRS